MPVAVLRCIECGVTSGDGQGWRALLVDDPEDPRAEPELALYCAECATREFDEDEPSSEPA